MACEKHFVKWLSKSVFVAVKKGQKSVANGKVIKQEPVSLVAIVYTVLLQTHLLIHLSQFRLLFIPISVTSTSSK